MTISTFSSEVIDAIRAANKAELLRLLNQDPSQLVQRDSHGGYTLLHYAVMDDDEAFMSELLERNAQIDAQDHVGMTPLHLAAQYGRLGMIRQLVQNGARMDITDNEGMTPLMWASSSRSGRAEEAASLLMSLGASEDLLSAVMRNETAEVGNVIATKPDAVVECRKLQAVLRATIVYQNLDILRLLLQHGLSPGHMQIDGLDPVTFACQCGAGQPIIDELAKASS